jgi:hypothetical protein
MTSLQRMPIRVVLLGLAVSACPSTSSDDARADATPPTDDRSGSDGAFDSAFDSASDAVAVDAPATDAPACDADGGCSGRRCCYQNHCVDNGQPCGEGNVCFFGLPTAGSCQACGHGGQPCCTGNACLDGGQCLPTPQGGRCTS